eukprot:2351239-Rhodomonas_salina.1
MGVCTNGSLHKWVFTSMGVCINGSLHQWAFVKTGVCVNGSLQTSGFTLAGQFHFRNVAGPRVLQYQPPAAHLVAA